MNDETKGIIGGQIITIILNIIIIIILLVKL